MNSNTARHALARAVQEQFSGYFPYLKIDFTRRKDTLDQAPSPSSPPNGKDNGQEDDLKEVATAMLWKEFGLSGDMKVSELEILLQYEFGLPARILRKSGNLWLETDTTNHWTLGQQDDHGREIATGFGSF